MPKRPNLENGAKCPGYMSLDLGLRAKNLRSICRGGEGNLGTLKVVELRAEVVWGTSFLIGKGVGKRRPQHRVVESNK